MPWLEKRANAIKYLVISLSPAVKRSTQTTSQAFSGKQISARETFNKYSASKKVAVMRSVSSTRSCSAPISSSTRQPVLWLTWTTHWSEIASWLNRGAFAKSGELFRIYAGVISVPPVHTYPGVNITISLTPISRKSTIIGSPTKWTPSTYRYRQEWLTWLHGGMPNMVLPLWSKYVEARKTRERDSLIMVE